MFQEIISYFIIVFAFGVAVYKISGSLKRKKITKEDPDKKIHNCSKCSAECVLREIDITVIKQSKALCDKIRMISE